MIKVITILIESNNLLLRLQGRRVDSRVFPGRGTAGLVGIGRGVRAHGACWASLSRLVPCEVRNNDAPISIQPQLKMDTNKHASRTREIRPL